MAYQPLPMNEQHGMKDHHSPFAGVDETVRFDAVANCEAEVQRGFLRKVFGLVAAQLTVTAMMCAVFMLSESVRTFVLGAPSMLFMTFISSMGFLFACFIQKDNHPTNLWCLLGFTVSIGWSIGVACAQYYANGMGHVVLQALSLTASVTVGLTLYTLRSKKDFSFLGAGLGSALWVLIFGGLVAALTGAHLLHLALTCAGAGIFSLYIVYDVYLISRRLSPDEYIPAAINLYLDIANLFLHILRILAAMQDRSG